MTLADYVQWILGALFILSSLGVILAENRCIPASTFYWHYCTGRLLFAAFRPVYCRDAGFGLCRRNFGHFYVCDRSFPGCPSANR